MPAGQAGAVWPCVLRCHRHAEAMMCRRSDAVAVKPSSSRAAATSAMSCGGSPGRRDRIAAPRTEIEDASCRRGPVEQAVQRDDMRARQIVDMDVITDRGAVGCRKVAAEYLEIG